MAVSPIPLAVKDTTSYAKANGYEKAVLDMASRFDANNKELNTQKFLQQTQHHFTQSKGTKTGAKLATTVNLQVTPEHSGSDKEEQKEPASQQSGLQLGESSSSSEGNQKKRKLEVRESP